MKCCAGSVYYRSNSKKHVLQIDHADFTVPTPQHKLLVQIIQIRNLSSLKDLGLEVGIDDLSVRRVDPFHDLHIGEGMPCHDDLFSPPSARPRWSLVPFNATARDQRQGGEAHASCRRRGGERIQDP